MFLSPSPPSTILAESLPDCMSSLASDENNHPPSFSQQDMDVPVVPEDVRLDKFKDIIVRHQINYDFALRLRALEGFQIVMILDDSTSMCSPIIDGFQDEISPFGRLPTRWDELKHIVSIVIDLGSTLDHDGIDVHFLNREPLLHVHDSSQLNETFSMAPNGPTPLTRVLSEILESKRAQVHDRKLLILIATDGVPTNESGLNDLQNLANVLMNDRFPVHDRIYVTFIACTNDLESVSYLNEFDKKIPFVDVLDDYPSERAEILSVQGKNFPFSYGDYVVKILMGSVDPWFDQLDEKKVKLSPLGMKHQRRLSRQAKAARRRSCLTS